MQNKCWRQEICPAIMSLHEKAWRAAKGMKITLREKLPARKRFRCYLEQHPPCFWVFSLAFFVQVSSIAGRRAALGRQAGEIPLPERRWRAARVRESDSVPHRSARGGRDLRFGGSGVAARSGGRVGLPGGCRAALGLRTCSRQRSGGAGTAAGGPGGAGRPGETDRTLGELRGGAGRLFWPPGGPDRAVAALASARGSATRRLRPARGRDRVVAAGGGRPNAQGATADPFGPLRPLFGPRGHLGGPFRLPESS